MDKKKLYESAIQYGLITKDISYKNFESTLNDEDARRQFYDKMVETKFITQDEVPYDKYERLLTPSDPSPITGSETVNQVQEIVDVPDLNQVNVDLLQPYSSEELAMIGKNYGDNISQDDRMAIQANELISHHNDGIRYSVVDSNVVIPDISSSKYKKVSEDEDGDLYYDTFNMKRFKLSPESAKQFRSDFVRSVSGNELGNMSWDEYVEKSPDFSYKFVSEYVSEDILDEYAKKHGYDFDKTKAEQFGSQFGLGFSKVFGDGLKMIDRIALQGLATVLMPDQDEAQVNETIDMLINDDFSVMSDSSGFKNLWQKFAKEQTVNPEFNNNLWLTDMPNALGSGTAFLGLGLATGGAGPVLSGGTMAGLGALSNAESQYEDAKNFGSSDRDAWLAALSGSIVGASEAIPLSRYLRRLNMANPGASKALLDRIRKGILETGKEGTEEAIQETVTQIANDFTAKTLVGYDPDRIIFDKDLIKSAQLGFLSGVIMTGAVRSVAGAKDISKETVDQLLSLQESIDEQFRGTDMEALVGKGIQGTPLENLPNQDEAEEIDTKTESTLAQNERQPAPTEESLEVSEDGETGRPAEIEPDGSGREVDGSETEDSSVESVEEQIPDSGQDDGQDRKDDRTQAESTNEVTQSTEEEVSPEVATEADQLPTTKEDAEAEGIEYMSRSGTNYFVQERDNDGRILSAYRIKRGKVIQYEGRVNDEGIYEIVEKTDDGDVIVPRAKTSVSRALYRKKRKDLSQDRQLISDTRTELEEEFGIVEDESGAFQFTEDINETLSQNVGMREKTIDQLDELSSRFDEMSSDMAIGFVSKINSLAERLSQMDQDQDAVIEEIEEVQIDQEKAPKIKTPERRDYEAKRVDSDLSLMPLQISRSDRREFSDNVSPEQLREAKIALLSGNVNDDTMALAASPELRRLARNGNTWANKIRQLAGQVKSEQKKAEKSSRVSAQNSALKSLRESGVQESISQAVQSRLKDIKKVGRSISNAVNNQILGGQNLGQKDLKRIFDEILEDNPGIAEVYNDIVNQLESSDAINEDLASKLGAPSPRALAEIIAQKQMFTTRGRSGGQFLDGTLDNNFATPFADAVAAQARKELGDISTHQMPQVWETFGTDPLAVSTRFTRRLMRRLFRRFPGINVHENLTVEEYQEAYRDSLGGVTDVARYPLGFVHESEIYFHPASPPNPATQVHELAHIWIQIAQTKYPSLMRRGLTLVENSPYMDQAERDYGLFDAAGLLNKEQVLEEALVDAITDGARNIVNRWDNNLGARFRKWLSGFWNKIAVYFGINSRNRAEIKDGALTLTGFAQMIANDIVSDVPIGMVRSVDIDNALRRRDKESMSAIRIDDGLLAVKLDRTWWSRKKFQFDEHTQSTRALPKWVDKRRRERLSRIEAARIRAEKLVNRLHEHIQQDPEYPRHVQAELYVELNNILSDRRKFFDFVRNETIEYGYGLEAANPNLVSIIMQMRHAIDSLSTQMVNAGMLSKGNEIAFNANLGLYLHRSYQVHENKDWATWIQKNDPETFQRAVDFIDQQMTSRNITNIKMEMREDGEGGGFTDIEFTNQHGKKWQIRGASPEYVQALIKAGYPLKPSKKSSKIDVQDGLITADITIDPEKPFSLPESLGDPMNYLPEEAEAYIISFLESHQPGERKYFVPTTEGAMQYGIITKRKDIPQVIRDVMGEHRDPRVNFMKSIIKQVSLIESYRYQKAIADLGKGILFDQDPTRKTGPFTERIASEGNRSFQPLAGYYTTPEIKECLDVAFSPRNAESNMMQALLMINSWTKSMATVYNVAGQIRNVLSAGIMLMNTGAIFNLFTANGRAELMEALTDAVNVSIELFSETGGRDQERWNHLAELGVINDNLSIQIIRDSLQRSQIDFRADGGGTLARIKQSGIGQWMERNNKLMENFYQLPDDAVKVVLFNLERSTLQRAYPDLTAEQLDRRAADIVRATLPVYSKAPKFVKKLSRNVLVGTFVSFTTEMFRTMAVNTPKMALEEMRSNNPVIRNRGIARMSGLLVGALGFLGAGAISAFLAGITDDEEEAVRESLPPWAKHSALLFTGQRDQDGRPIVFDMSNLDPMSVLIKPFVTAFGLSNTQEDLNKKLAVFFEPFFGSEIGVGAIADIVFNDKNVMQDAFSDKPTYQQKIYQPAYGNLQMMYDVSMYLMRKLGPRSFNTLGNLGKGGINSMLPGTEEDYQGIPKWFKEMAKDESRHESISPYNRTFGKEFLELVTGTKGYAANAEAATYFQAQNFKTYLSSVKRDKNLEKFRDSANSSVEKEFNILNRKVQAFVRSGMITQDQMFGKKGILKERVRLDNKTIDALEKGIFDESILDKKNVK